MPNDHITPRIARWVCLALIVLALPRIARSSDGTGTVAFLTSGAMPSGLVERVQIHLGLNLGISIRPVASPNEPVHEFDAAAEAWTKLRVPRDHCLIALVTPATATNLRGRVYFNESVGILNVQHLATIKPHIKDLSIEEHIARRVEKEAMRAVGLLLGMQACPSVRCAMRTPAGASELDNKGRNYCPPCWAQSMRITGVDLQERNRRMFEGNGIAPDQKKSPR